MKKFKIGVLGASGRMGQKILHLLKTEFSQKVEVVAAVDQSASFANLSAADVIIDFSSPGALALLEKEMKSWKRLPDLVVGTTGWTPATEKPLKRLSARTRVVYASNFSIGVFLLGKILKDYSPILYRLGYSASISETHHIHKKDAPSGTAKTLQLILGPKNPSSIQTESIREGEVIGDHTVTFQGKEEKISVGHSAQDRSIFARGSIESALYLAKTQKGRRRGLLSLEDTLKERTSRK